MRYPIVIVSALDHVIDPSSPKITPPGFMAVGVLVETTRTHWRLINWIFSGKIKDSDNASMAVVRTPGAKLITIGHIETEE